MGIAADRLLQDDPARDVHQTDVEKARGAGDMQLSRVVGIGIDMDPQTWIIHIQGAYGRIIVASVGIEKLQTIVIQAFEWSRIAERIRRTSVGINLTFHQSDAFKILGILATLNFKMAVVFFRGS